MPVYLVSATIVDERDRHVGMGMLDVEWENAPRDRADADQRMASATEASWSKGTLSRTFRYRIVAWSEYGR
jgi:hypothetical protein